MPESQGCLPDICRDSADIQSSGHSKSVSGSVIENTPAEASVHLHRQIPPEEQQLDGVRTVVIEELVTGGRERISDGKQNHNKSVCLSV